MNWLWYSDSLFKKELLKLNKYHKHNLFKKNTILKKFTKNNHNKKYIVTLNIGYAFKKPLFF